MSCKINDETGTNAQLVDLINQFFPYSKTNLGFEKPVTVSLVSSQENAGNPLGKTAHYDPQSYEVVIYTDGRHVKDMLRSLSHELVHHNQNCQGNFGDEVCQTGQGYAQKDEFLRKMEKEAYLKGNMIFRDWEDSIKEQEIMKINENLKGVPAETVKVGDIVSVDGQRVTVYRADPPDEWAESVYWWTKPGGDPTSVPANKKVVVVGHDPDAGMKFGSQGRERRDENKTIGSKQGEKTMSSKEKPLKEWVEEERYNNLSERFGFKSNLSKLKESCDKEELEEEEGELEEGFADNGPRQKGPRSFDGDSTEPRGGNRLRVADRNLDSNEIPGGGYSDGMGHGRSKPVAKPGSGGKVRGGDPMADTSHGMHQPYLNTKNMKLKEEEGLDERGLPGKKSVDGKEIPQPPHIKKKASKVPKPPHMMEEEEGTLDEQIKYAKKMVNFYGNRNGFLNRSMAEQAKHLLRALQESKTQKGEK